MRIPADHIKPLLAKLRAGTSCCNLVAHYVGETSARDQDGWSGRLVVCDGYKVRTVEAERSGSRFGEPGMAIDADGLEMEIEQRAASYPLESRLEDLVAASPIRL